MLQTSLLLIKSLNETETPIFMPPTLKKLVGHIGLPLFVCLLVRSSRFFCACHILQTVHVRVLKFHIWVPHEK